MNVIRILRIKPFVQQFPIQILTEAGNWISLNDAEADDVWFVLRDTKSRFKGIKGEDINTVSTSAEYMLAWEQWVEVVYKLQAHTTAKEGIKKSE